MLDGLRSILCAAALAVLSVPGIAGGPAAAADVLTIQGSSTFSTNILTPNEAAIEAISGQSIKIVGIRSDIGLLRLLARQAEFAVISTSLQHAIDALRPNNPDMPYERLMAFPVSQVRVAFAVHPDNPVRKASQPFPRTGRKLRLCGTGRPQTIWTSMSR